MTGPKRGERFTLEGKEGGIMDWRYQLGIIVPSWNTTMEYECWRMAPQGVSVHTSRIAHTADSDEAALRMVEKAPGAAELLAHAKVNAICFGCTGASFRNLGVDPKIIKEIEAHTKTPTTTTSSAIVDVLKHLGVKSVAIASPYAERTNGLLAKFLEFSGFRVVSQKGLNVECPAFLPPESAYKAALDVDCKEADLILISCTNFRSMEVIQKLEKELGKPVVSSNTASMWKLLQLAGVKERVEGLGQLFEPQVNR
jgi:maleate isomerase